MISIIARGGHDPWYTHRVVFFDAVRSFLRGTVDGA